MNPLEIFFVPLQTPQAEVAEWGGVINKKGRALLGTSSLCKLFLVCPDDEAPLQ